MADPLSLQVAGWTTATEQNASSLVQTTSVGEDRLRLIPQLLLDGARFVLTASLDLTSTTHQPSTWAAGYSQAGLPSLAIQLPVPTPNLPLLTLTYES